VLAESTGLHRPEKSGLPCAVAIVLEAVIAASNPKVMDARFDWGFIRGSPQRCFCLRLLMRVGPSASAR
jgi:hypothetical protein